MHSLLGVVVVASIGYLGTMFDNLFAFAAQLLVTDRKRFRRIGWAQASAIAVLVVLAAGVGSLLAPIPIRWVGVLCLAPWALAAHAWRHLNDEEDRQFRRGALTTFTLTLVLGGDNLAVWIPLLRANGVGRAILTVAVFAVWEVVFIVSAQYLTSRPRIVQWGTRHASRLIPWVYLLLGVMILVECGTI